MKKVIYQNEHFKDGKKYLATGYEVTHPNGGKFELVEWTLWIDPKDQLELF
jgi:hypothetical protein